MCGIAGWVSWQKDLTKEQEVLDKMRETLLSRGPDDQGIWLSPTAGLVHRRLIVVDPAGGVQPMTRSFTHERYTMVYNGELYNTEDLRDYLLKRGYRFQGHSDTEVLLNSFMEWGPDCTQRLNGIFAFAVWDETAQRLFLARDRLGVKPLFYKETADGLLFASEIKSLLTHPQISPRIDRDGLAELIVLGPARTPGHGVFDGVKELAPAHWLLLSSSGIKHQQYWRLTNSLHTENAEETAEKVRWLLTDTVKRQLVSDVPVCTLLSGGLDSSALSALAAQYYQEQNRGSLDTYSVDYVDNQKHFQANEFQPQADTYWAPKVADYLGTNHHSVNLDTPQLTTYLTDAMLARDLPGMADVDSSLLLFCQEIKRNATVALSGECADEIFGGYPWFYRQEALSSDTFPWMREQQHLLGFFSQSILKKINAPEYLNYRYRQALDEVPQASGEDAHQAKLRQLLYLTLTRWMPVLLDRKDRMSMAVGLEVRVPFCDHRLVEYAWNIPWKIKNHGGMEKGILRKAMEGILPHDVIYRKKSPYPKTHNPAYFKAVSTTVQRILDNPASPILPLINRAAVRRLCTAKDDKLNLPWFGQLMSGPQLLAYLIQFNQWLEHYNVEIDV